MSDLRKIRAWWAANGVNRPIEIRFKLVSGFDNPLWEFQRPTDHEARDKWVAMVLKPRIRAEAFIDGQVYEGKSSSSLDGALEALEQCIRNWPNAASFCGVT